MAKWSRRWKAIELTYCSNFQKAYGEEWEQEVHTSDDLLQERECHRENFNACPTNISEHETFACLTRSDPWMKSDSPCEPFRAQKPASIPNGLPSTPPGLPLTPQSSWRSSVQIQIQRRTLGSSRDMCRRPPDEPAVVKPVVPEIVHPVQYGITPQRLLLPHSDTEILSHMDDVHTRRLNSLGYV